MKAHHGPTVQSCLWSCLQCLERVNGKPNTWTWCPQHDAGSSMYFYVFLTYIFGDCFLWHLVNIVKQSVCNAACAWVVRRIFDMPSVIQVTVLRWDLREGNPKTPKTTEKCTYRTKETMKKALGTMRCENIWAPGFLFMYCHCYVFRADRRIYGMIYDEIIYDIVLMWCFSMIDIQGSGFFLA